MVKKDIIRAITETPKLQPKPIEAPESIAKPTEQTSVNPAHADYEKWKTENPGGGFYEYMYGRNIPRPEEVDEGKAKKIQNAAVAADILNLVGQGFAAAGGGIVNRQENTATGSVDARLIALRDKYQKRREDYNAGRQAAIYKDVEIMRAQEALRERAAREKANLVERARLNKDLEGTKQQNRIEIHNAEVEGRRILQNEGGRIRKDIVSTQQNGMNRRLNAAEDGRNNRATEAEAGRNNRAAEAERGRNNRSHGANNGLKPKTFTPSAATSGGNKFDKFKRK